MPSDESTSIVDKLALIVSSLALIASALFGIFNLLLASANEDRLDRQEQQQASILEEQRTEKLRAQALQVTLEEAPSSAVSRHGNPKIGRLWFVVSNHTKAQINGVWIEGKNGTSIRIDGIQACHLYGAADGFEPVAVHYSNGEGTWRRDLGSGVPELTGKPMPPSDTADSPWYDPIDNC